MPNRSTLIAPIQRSAGQTHAEAAPPFLGDSIHRTVLKFVNPLCQQTLAPTASSETVVAAMQRLAAMLNTLRASPLGTSKGLSGYSAGEAKTLQALIPYLSEEAYDVLDALHEERRQKETASSQHTPTEQEATAVSGQPPLNRCHLSPLSPSFTTIDTLIPSLLWSVARSAYSAMHLIEGIRAECWQPAQGWAFGMLRLVVMLEAEAPTARWCFDLATGYPAELLLEPTAIVQSDEVALPIRCASAEGRMSESPCQVQHQLQAVLQQLQTELPGLDTFVQGVEIELLQPGADWQVGKLRLRFGFAFSVQPHNVAESQRGQTQPELIEAELMDETAGNTSRLLSTSAAPAGQPIAEHFATAHVSVISPVPRSLSPATLVRLTATEILERYTQQTARQQLERSLAQLRNPQALSGDEDAQLALIVQAAATIHQPDAAGIGLLRPMLLMDELVPKLLWTITSSTYDLMQLVGGLPAQVLQPNASWQQGMLRLLPTLHLKAAEIDYTFDLSTGRSVDAARLDIGTIVQTNATVCSQPTSIAVLTAHLQQQLYNTVPEYRLLMDGLSMAWLEDVEQDWQSGTMKLSASLAFVPDAL